MNNDKKNILIIDTNFKENSLYTLEYIRPIKNIIKKLDINIEVIHYTRLPKEIKEYSKYSHIILSGTGLKDNQYLKNIKEFEILTKLNIPIFGICAGAQILNLIYNNKLETKTEIGIFKPEIIKEDKIIQNCNLKEIYLIHNNSIIENSKIFETIIKTKVPQLVKIKNKNIYLCQFHPEIKNKKIIENFLKI